MDGPVQETQRRGEGHGALLPAPSIQVYPANSDEL